MFVKLYYRPLIYNYKYTLLSTTFESLLEMHTILIPTFRDSTKAFVSDGKLLVFTVFHFSRNRGRMVL